MTEKEPEIVTAPFPFDNSIVPDTKVKVITKYNMNEFNLNRTLVGLKIAEHLPNKKYHMAKPHNVSSSTMRGSNVEDISALVSGSMRVKEG